MSEICVIEIFKSNFRFRKTFDRRDFNCEVLPINPRICLEDANVHCQLYSEAKSARYTVRRMSQYVRNDPPHARY